MKDSRKLPGVHVVAGTPDSSLAARELNFLVRLAQAAASTQRPDELLELIIRETTSAIGTDVCSLYLLTTPGRQLLLTATNGLNENMIGKVTMKVGEGITGWVAESRRPAVVPDVSKEPHWKWVPGLDEDRFHSMASVPIESGPRLVGVINVQSTERREFNSGDIDFLRAIAGQVAGILERSELQRRTEVQLAEISLSHDIHERFTKLSLEGAGIPSILDVIGSLAGGRAALYSVDGYRVRLAGESADGMPPRIHVPPAAGGIAREVRISAGRPPRPLDVVPVRAGSDMLGMLAVGLGQGVDAEGRLRALEHGSTGAALELASDLASVERLGSQILAAAAPVMKPGSASVGIGNLANGVAELARSHVEARQALRLTRRAGSRAHVASYRSLGAFRLLLEVQSPDALRRFVNELLGPLLEYAQNRDTPLLETLEALSAARWIRRAAARQLGIHINSMTYRVERIQTLTGLQLDDPETRVAISIALRARAMLGMRQIAEAI